MPQFQVIDLDSSAPIMAYDGDSGREAIRLFATGGEAASFASDMTQANPGKKFQPRPFLIDESVWRSRERYRFESGYYTKPVWCDAPWYVDSIVAQEHFCHVSRVDASRIAYTATSEKGAQDIQTPARPGAYLKKFFAEILNDAQIQQWTLAHETRLGVAALKFATTPEEIDRVYRHGPRSCMCNPDDYPRILNRDIFPLHPAHIYAAGDLAIAYCESRGRVQGRCVVWPSKKRYGRIYGDRLHDLLVSAGYTQQPGWNFEGARLLKVRNSHYGSWCMPYIDGSNYAHDSDCGKFFVIGSPPRGRASYSCGNTSGTTQSRDESYDDDDDYEDERPICEHCEERYDDGEGVYVRDISQYWCDSCADADAVCCEATGDYVREDYVILADGTCWSLRHYESHGSMCEDCSEHYHCDDMTRSEYDDCDRCADCHAAHLTDNAPLDEREPSPTIDAPNQVTMTLGHPVESWRVAAYSLTTGEFAGFISLDWQTGKQEGTREDCAALITRLGANPVYRYEAQRVQPATTLEAAA